MDLTEETGSIELQNSFRSEEPTPMNKKQTDSTGEQELKKGIETMIFFRIWFGLTKEEFCKAFIGSVAAAFAGISKPVFGFFIITIGVEYYKSNSKQKVGILSVLFSSIGLLSLLAHTMQHYLFGVVGEKVMTNLRQALYTGITLYLYTVLPFLLSALLRSELVEQQSVKTVETHVFCLQPCYAMNYPGLKGLKTVLDLLRHASSMKHPL